MKGNAVSVLSPGTQLDQGRYIVTEFIGRGGSAITYKARQRKFSSEIAIREYYPLHMAKRKEGSPFIVPAEEAVSKDFDRGKRSFWQEGSNLRDLTDISNIVKVYDVFEDFGTVYMVEDYVEGETLQSVLEREKQISFVRAFEILRPVMEALIKVHKHDMIHRDVKPSNIILDRGTPYLIDFGISQKVVYSTTVSSFRENSAERETSYTRGYAALEQIRGNAREGFWTDVYGVAATMYRMVTGLVPDDAEARYVEDHLIPPRKAGADLNSRQEEVLLKGLSIDAAARYQSVQAFLNALEESFGSGRNKKGRKLLPAAIGMIAAGAVAFAVPRLGLFPNKPPEEKTMEEEPGTVPFTARIFDSQGDPLKKFHVRIRQVITEEGGNTQSKLLYSGQADEFGWLPELEAEDRDSFLQIILQETENTREYSIEDIKKADGNVSLNYPFHFYPVTYNYGGHTYAFGNLSDNEKLTSYDAVKEYCEDLGGHLAVINNGEEDAYLYELACKVGISTCFFGYTDQKTEGEWVWAYGSSEYTNWTREGGVHPAPDNGGPSYGPENYAEYNCGPEGSNDGSWNDAKFAVNTERFIIEWEFEKPE